MIQEIVPGVFRSSLPRAKDIARFAELGGVRVVDLTQRERATVRRACDRYSVAYEKHPMPYEGADALAAAKVILGGARPVLFHCFHGRGRTGRVARAIEMMEYGEVWLYKVGRNLSRAVRTCEAFGVKKLVLVDCNESYLSGNLYGATGRVSISRADSLPSGPGVLALETGPYPPIYSIDLSRTKQVIIGGETSGLPRTMSCQYATIPMSGNVSGLTVEGALAIALYEWSR